MHDRSRTVTEPAWVGPGDATPAASGHRRRRRRRFLLAIGIAALPVLFFAVGSLLNWGAGVSSQSNSAELASFAGHRAPVRCLAISADGDLATSGDESGSLLVWTVKDRQRRSELVGHQLSIECVCLSPDGKLAASGDAQGNLRVWDVPGSHPQAAAVGHRGAVTGVVLHPAKTHLLSAGRDGRIVLWKIPDSSAGDPLQLVRQSDLSPAEVTCLARTPDGLEFLAGDSFGRLTLWNLADLARCAASMPTGARFAGWRFLRWESKPSPAATMVSCSAVSSIAAK